MPPSLEASLAREKTPVTKKPLVQRRLVFGDGVISRSPERAPSHNAKGKRAVKPRIYGDGPLPFKPSDEAPRDARIVGRLAEPGKQPIYTLKVGDIEMDDISLHEILEYVSPYELERYEHQQFEEEREAMDAALAAAAEEEERRRARHKERAKRKGVIHFEEIDDEDEVDHNGSAKGTGRARPTYKHLFKVPQERRRRRKRDPITGELLPLSDEELPKDVEMESSEDSQPLPQGRAAGPAFGDLQKRRRRKRDPVTGELLPLAPLPQSLPQKIQEPPPRQSSVGTPRSEVTFTSLEPKTRPRRRRHPLTGELMPLGWKYDPSAEQESYEARRDISPSMRKLSISQEQQPKRVKLASESSADDVPQPRRPLSSSGRKSPEGTPKLHLPTLDVSEIDDLALNDRHYQTISPRNLKSPPETSMLRPDAQKASSESSGEPVTLASFLKSSTAQQDASDSDDSLNYPQKPAVRNTPTQGRTSIMNPVAAKMPVTEEEDSDSDLEEGEWFIEAIVGHKLSDPRTHPGKPSVMLYHTKWERSEELTWEPAESFSDPNAVADYRRRVGLDKGKQAVKSPSRVVPVVFSSISTSASKSHERKSFNAAQPTLTKAIDKQEEEEEEE